MSCTSRKFAEFQHVQQLIELRGDQAILVAGWQTLVTLLNGAGFRHAYTVPEPVGAAFKFLGNELTATDFHIDSYARLVAETAAWEKRRNAERACIKWMFTTEKARAKMGRAYPKPTAKSGRTQRVKTSVTRY